MCTSTSILTISIPSIARLSFTQQKSLGTRVSRNVGSPTTNASRCGASSREAMLLELYLTPILNIWEGQIKRELCYLKAGQQPKNNVKCSFEFLWHRGEDLPYT